VESTSIHRQTLKPRAENNQDPLSKNQKSTTRANAKSKKTNFTQEQNKTPIDKIQEQRIKTHDQHTRHKFQRPLTTEIMTE